MNPATLAQIHAIEFNGPSFSDDGGRESLGVTLSPPPSETEGETPTDHRRALRAWARPARRFLCEGCDTAHLSHDSAMECCPRDIPEVWVDAAGKTYCTPGELAKALPNGSGPSRDGLSPNCCPVCGDSTSSPHSAVECCLWKDLDHLTRWKVADAVDAGTPWREALAPYMESK